MEMTRRPLLAEAWIQVFQLPTKGSTEAEVATLGSWLFFRFGLIRSLEEYIFGSTSAWVGVKSREQKIRNANYAIESVNQSFSVCPLSCSESPKSMICASVSIQTVPSHPSKLSEFRVFWNLILNPFANFPQIIVGLLRYLSRTNLMTLYSTALRSNEVVNTCRRMDGQRNRCVITVGPGNPGPCANMSHITIKSVHRIDLLCCSTEHFPAVHESRDANYI